MDRHITARREYRGCRLNAPNVLLAAAPRTPTSSGSHVGRLSELVTRQCTGSITHCHDSSLTKVVATS